MLFFHTLTPNLLSFANWLKNREILHSYKKSEENQQSSQGQKSLKDTLSQIGMMCFLLPTHTRLFLAFASIRAKESVIKSKKSLKGIHKGTHCLGLTAVPVCQWRW